jgi:FeS assembly SUF system protein
MSRTSGRVPLEMEKPTAPVAPAEPVSAQTSPVAAPTEPIDISVLHDKIMETLRGCFDPEIPVNIVELGLIYEVKVQETGAVAIRMTLTSPACPAAGSLPPEVEAKVKALPGVISAKVDVVWEPTWTQDLMSEAARLQLGLY